MSWFAGLAENDAYRKTADYLAVLDSCFLVGFGRLGPDQVAALDQLAAIFHGTPLGAAVAAGVEAIKTNEFVDKHFAAIALGRAALQGAQFDGLLSQVRTALGREAAPAGDPRPVKKQSESGPVMVWQESARTWLMEVALSGFRQLDDSTISPFLATLDQIVGATRLSRLGAILSGFVHELFNALPMKSQERLPVNRWADLWTRSMLAALRDCSEPAGDKVSGDLTLLGFDLRQHGMFVSGECYAVLQAKEIDRLVRIPFSSYKVDAVPRSEAWKCLHPHAGGLYPALEGKTLSVSDMTLLPTGELLWTGKAGKVGAAPKYRDTLERFAPAAKNSPTLMSVAGGDRHPIQLAEPVYLAGASLAKDGESVTLAEGASIPLSVNAMQRMTDMAELDFKKIAGVFGLLRHDGAWSFQPLLQLADDGKKTVMVGARSNEAIKAKKQALDTLTERASRLLRQKK